MDAKAEIETEAQGSERRVHPRIIRVALAVRVGGRTYKTVNWSMGGFMLDDYEGDLSTGALVTVAGIGRSARKLLDVELPARVVRTAENIIAVNYLSLDHEAYDFLQIVMSETGKMRNLMDEVS